VCENARQTAGKRSDQKRKGKGERRNAKDTGETMRKVKEKRRQKEKRESAAYTEEEGTGGGIMHETLQEKMRGIDGQEREGRKRNEKVLRTQKRKGTGGGGYMKHYKRRCEV